MENERRRVNLPGSVDPRARAASCTEEETERTHSGGGDGGVGDGEAGRVEGKLSG